MKIEPVIHRGRILQRANEIMKSKEKVNDSPQDSNLSEIKEVLKLFQELDLKGLKKILKLLKTNQI